MNTIESVNGMGIWNMEYGHVCMYCYDKNKALFRGGHYVSDLFSLVRAFLRIRFNIFRGFFQSHWI